MSRPANRRRASSVTDALKQVPLNQQGASRSATPVSVGRTTGTIGEVSEVKPLPAGRPRKTRKDDLPEQYESKGFWGDLTTGRWMLVPSSAFIIMMISPIFYLVLEQARKAGHITNNPFKYVLFLQGRQANGLYTKGWADLAFVLHQVILWSFVRQFVTLQLLRPLAYRLGIKGNKVMRFLEQGYAIFYFTITSTVGLNVMRNMPIWWYKTEEFWLGYPHRAIPFQLKLYYLLQASYWVQQTILLAGKIEKPRKDFKELIAHHIVTLWLIGWSYNVHLTYIGVAIFLTMDISDIFLALAKCVNYVSEYWSQFFFAFFVGVWTYFRHYLNLKILWSVYTEFDLIPVAERTVFRPFQEDKWMDWWMKWQIFTPIALLQVINLFWYFLIWRILIRALLSAPLADERSDDEDDEPSPKEKAKKVKGKKAE